MKTIVLLLALATLAACSTTGHTPSYVPGEGDYYQGIVAPR